MPGLVRQCKICKNARICVRCGIGCVCVVALTSALWLTFLITDGSEYSKLGAMAQKIAKGKTCARRSLTKGRDFARKRVLLWTLYFGSQSWWQGYSGNNAFSGCPEARCELTYDRCLQPVSDAVLFHIPSTTHWDLPLSHPPAQLWVAFSQESPEDAPFFSRWLLRPRNRLNDVFNLTSTYRWDSDIYAPYFKYSKILNSTHMVSLTPDATVFRIPPGLAGSFKRAVLVDAKTTTTRIGRANFWKTAHTLVDSALPDKLTTNYARKKTKKILWFVSNCRSPMTRIRMLYAQELKKHIEVDIYGEGNCGPLLGAKHDPCKNKKERAIIEKETGKTCLEGLFAQYKFYLAFENARCHWYITEKLGKALVLQMLPVVLGATIQEVATIAPENSFLHVDNFTSPRQLAEYLRYLDNHDDAYNRYFAWRQNHVSAFTYEMRRWCDVCEALWKEPPVSKSYPHFSHWYGQKQDCDIPTRMGKG